MDKLNLLRIEAGWSIADLARRLRVDQSTVCNWLSGQTCPAPHQLRALARLLRVEMHVLDSAGSGAQQRTGLRGRFVALGSRFRAQDPRSRAGHRF